MDQNRAMKEFEEIEGEDYLVVSVVTPTRWFQKLPPFLSISEAGSACACDLIPDDDPSTAETWYLFPDMLLPMANTVEEIHHRAKSEIELEAVFGGDIVETVEEVSIEEITELIRNNHLGNMIRYRIR